MAIIKYPVPGMKIKELKEVYENRKLLGLVDCSWENYYKKYENIIKEN